LTLLSVVVHATTDEDEISEEEGEERRFMKKARR